MKLRLPDAHLSGHQHPTFEPNGGEGGIRKSLPARFPIRPRSGLFRFALPLVLCLLMPTLMPTLTGCGGELLGRGGGTGANPLAGSWGGETSHGAWHVNISPSGVFDVEQVGTGTINNLGVWSVAGMTGRMTPRSKPTVADLSGDVVGILHKKVAL